MTSFKDVYDDVISFTQKRNVPNVFLITMISPKSYALIITAMPKIMISEAKNRNIIIYIIIIIFIIVAF